MTQYLEMTAYPKIKLSPIVGSMSNQGHASLKLPQWQSSFLANTKNLAELLRIHCENARESSSNRQGA
jgi:hypothetical protein